MKIRNGFVSNSSSSSFIVKYEGDKTLEEIKSTFRLREEVPNYVKEYLYQSIYWQYHNADFKKDRFFCGKINSEWINKISKEIYEEGFITDNQRDTIINSFKEGDQYVDVYLTDFDCCEDLDYEDGTISEDDIMNYIRDNAEVISDDYSKMFGYSVG